MIEASTIAIGIWIIIAVVLVAIVAGFIFVRFRKPVVPPEPPARAPRPAPDPGTATATTAETPEAAPVAEAAPVVEAPAPAPPSVRGRLGRARGAFAGFVGSVRSRGVDASTWDELEEALLRADIGVATTDVLIADLRRRVDAKEVVGAEQVLAALRADLIDLLEVENRWDAASDEAADRLGDPVTTGEGEAEPTGRDLRLVPTEGRVNVWLFVGVNGVGKTTTVGKVARQQAAAGHRVLLAAGDTFRAAAGEQLAMWAERSGADIVRGAEGGDPSAIVFDAVQRGAARGHDLVLADTAGRLHNKVNLVEELKKIRRVADRPPGLVTEVLLVIDATTGQNALAQARQFTEAVAVTGLVLTKLDGTAKGGIVVAVQRELGVPVKLVGLGEGPDDLVPFDPVEFVDALLD